MILAGLLCMTGTDEAGLDALTEAVGVPALRGSARLVRKEVYGISGWGCKVELPPAHEHRTLADIAGLIGTSRLDPEARELSLRAFTLLAEAEARVHGMPVAEVRFHEVGALDSILDICLACALFVRLGPLRFTCGPLPLADGGVRCAHGWIPTPAPAVLELLEGVAVCGFRGRGETVTPTALALLRALGASFGPWPALRVERRALVYGDRVFPDAPNGAVWACGPALS